MTAKEIIGSVGSIVKPAWVPYGTKISAHLTVGLDNLTSPDTGALFLLPQLVQLFEAGREMWGKPIPVTAGYRTIAHEDALRAAGYKTAKVISPHSLGAALDTDVGPPAENKRWRETLADAAGQLGLPVPRFGFTAYGGEFLHVDLAFLLFKPWTPIPNPLPDTFKPGVWW